MCALGVAALMRCTWSSLTTLDLSSNHFGSDGAAALADGVLCLPALRNLNLRYVPGRLWRGSVGTLSLAVLGESCECLAKPDLPKYCFCILMHGVSMLGVSVIWLSLVH